MRVRWNQWMERKREIERYFIISSVFNIRYISKSSAVGILVEIAGCKSEIQNIIEN